MLLRGNRPGTWEEIERYGERERGREGERNRGTYVEKGAGN